MLDETKGTLLWAPEDATFAHNAAQPAAAIEPGQATHAFLTHVL